MNVSHDTNGASALDAERLARRINLALVFDHVGRAGNGFFLSIFDQHPQVLTTNWVHYLYSYIVNEFGEADVLDSRRALEFITSRSYFRYVFNEPRGEAAETMRRFGADPNTPLDRAKARNAFEAAVLKEGAVKRRDLILAAYAAYALAAGRDLEQVRYVLLSDAVSLRSEHVRDGFSGKVLGCALADFPKARFMSLVRDPRAMFASNRHQFVNGLDNMYALSPSSALRRLKELTGLDQRPDNSVWLYWLWYAAQTAKTINRLKQEHPDHFLTVRNEDLNLRFAPTMRALCAWLDVDFFGPWSDAGYVPTSAGRPWRGTGAYNSRYQTRTTGPLLNDPIEVADKVTGPNRYVTERWRTRLAPHEIELVDLLFAGEMRQLGYAPLASSNGSSPKTLAQILRKPFRGELPSLRWLRDGLGQGGTEFSRRLFYALAHPAFAALSRVQMLRLHARGVFNNPYAAGEDPTLLRIGTANPEQGEA